MHTLSVESIINIDFIEVMLGSLPQNILNSVVLKNETRLWSWFLMLCLQGYLLLFVVRFSLSNCLL